MVKFPTLLLGYARAARQLWSLALSTPVSRRGDYPIWGTCLGFEQLAVLSHDEGNDNNSSSSSSSGGEQDDILVDCQSENQRSSLLLSDDGNWSNSTLGGDMPKRIRKAVTGRRLRPIFNRCVNDLLCYYRK